jgi:hypothetical protein
MRLTLRLALAALWAGWRRLWVRIGQIPGLLYHKPYGTTAAFRAHDGVVSSAAWTDELARQF